MNDSKLITNLREIKYFAFIAFRQPAFFTSPHFMLGFQNMHLQGMALNNITFTWFAIVLLIPKIVPHLIADIPRFAVPKQSIQCEMQLPV
ncbi:MAG: hypothetical protein IPP32_13730 [Bacteroidetes bacterium]|nr:hypothetical protein [Bacteroidota bacterium]